MVSGGGTLDNVVSCIDGFRFQLVDSRQKKKQT